MQPLVDIVMTTSSLPSRSMFVLLAALSLSGFARPALAGSCEAPKIERHGACVPGRQDWRQARNADNPYDSAGLMHNAVLANFFQSSWGAEFRADADAQTLQPIDHYFAPYFAQQRPVPGWTWHWSWPDARGVTFDPQPIFDFMATVHSTKDWLRLSKYPLSKRFMDYVNQMETRAQALDTSGDYSVVKSLEAEIAAAPKLKDRERRELLTLGSVMRYSYAYWSDPANGWRDGAARRRINWWHVLFVDALAFAVTGNPGISATISAYDVWVQMVH